MKKTRLWKNCSLPRPFWKHIPKVSLGQGIPDLLGHHWAHFSFFFSFKPWQKDHHKKEVWFPSKQKCIVAFHTHVVRAFSPSPILLSHPHFLLILHRHLLNVLLWWRLAPFTCALMTGSNFFSRVVGSRVRVTLVDERIYVGTLDCVDSEGNISIGESKLFFVDKDGAFTLTAFYLLIMCACVCVSASVFNCVVVLLRCWCDGE
jgi:small nuclear ribonucleoprotein (snRNP)-like protein